MIADIVTAVLGNLSVVLFVVALVVGWVKVRRKHATGPDAAYILWGEVVFYAVGLGFVWFGVMHAFFGPVASKMIGWETSPFEWELAWGEIGVAVVAILSLWRGYEMRLAATLIFAIFSFGAAAQHIHFILCCANYAPGNAGLTLWFSDIALPLVILGLALASRHARRL